MTGRDVAYSVTVKTRAPGFDRPGEPRQYLHHAGVYPVYVGETEEQARMRIGRTLGYVGAAVVLTRWEL